jgi:hypothetical protein
VLLASRVRTWHKLLSMCKRGVERGCHTVRKLTAFPSHAVTDERLGFGGMGTEPTPMNSHAQTGKSSWWIASRSYRQSSAETRNGDKLNEKSSRVMQDGLEPQSLHQNEQTNSSTPISQYSDCIPRRSYSWAAQNIYSTGTTNPFFYLPNRNPFSITDRAHKLVP